MIGDLQFNVVDFKASHVIASFAQCFCVLAAKRSNPRLHTVAASKSCLQIASKFANAYKADEKISRNDGAHTLFSASRRDVLTIAITKLK